MMARPGKRASTMLDTVFDTMSSASEFRVMSTFVRDWVLKTFALWTAPEDVHVGSDGIIELRRCELELRTVEELRLPLRPRRATLGSVKFSTFSREVVVDGVLLLFSSPTASEAACEAHVARSARLALVSIVEQLLREVDPGGGGGRGGDAAAAPDGGVVGPAAALAFREWSLRATSVHCRVECGVSGGGGGEGTCAAAGASAEEIFISPAAKYTSATRMPSVLDLGSRRRPNDESWSVAPEWTRKVVFNGFRVYGRPADAPFPRMTSEGERDADVEANARSRAAAFGPGFRALRVRVLDGAGLPRANVLGFATRAYATVRAGHG